MDSTLAYTNKDYERLVGDAGLKKQVKLPKEKLGLCTSLALETNGKCTYHGSDILGKCCWKVMYLAIFAATSIWPGTFQKSAETKWRFRRNYKRIFES